MINNYRKTIIIYHIFIILKKDSFLPKKYFSKKVCVFENHFYKFALYKNQKMNNILNNTWWWSNLRRTS